MYEDGNAAIKVGTHFSSAQDAINAFCRYDGAQGRELRWFQTQRPPVSLILSAPERLDAGGW